ncbi:hypothetical protein H2248_004009 [Termitomyces sp. 'cryptogamus']|nr:hypothetical protein H2248_004009 [Termitomyces sp. 'cryptogamus']
MTYRRRRTTPSNARHRPPTTTTQRRIPRGTWTPTRTQTRKPRPRPSNGRSCPGASTSLGVCRAIPVACLSRFGTRRRGGSRRSSGRNTRRVGGWRFVFCFCFILMMYSGAASGTAVPPSPMLSTLSPSAPPPAKRRRAKRTEEERKAYLGSDPYVERFEAYRVLCKSCDKWIWLRFDSTYNSIPWDAHRKSCLAKKINSKNVYALEQRNALFSKDPDVRKFDAERVLCNLCDNWLPLDPDNHLVAVQAWLQHRAACQHARPPPSASPKPEPTPPPSQPTPPPSQPFHDLNPANYAPAHESRRRNAEQRAATLRADSLIAQVEPNRVFCSLCQNWVQLRQDSSYCASPWLQHRGKCLARHQRRTAKAVEVAEAKARKLGQLVHPPSSSSAHPHSPRRALRSLSADLELESEDERVDIPEDVYRRQCEREREREREHEHEREREREHERERDRASFHAAYKADGERDPEMAESGPLSGHRASVSYPHREREREAPHVYSHGHGHSHSHLHGAHPYSHAHAHPYSHGYAYPYSYTHAHPYSYTHAHPYSHAHAHPYSHGYAHPYSHAHAHPYSTSTPPRAVAILSSAPSPTSAARRTSLQTR